MLLKFYEINKKLGAFISVPKDLSLLRASGP